MTIETNENQQTGEKKPKKTPDIEIRTRKTVEACASRLESLADTNQDIKADVALLPQDGKWALDITREYTRNPYSITYFKLKFHGYLQRTENNGTLLIGDVMPDVATYITRGLYLVLLGPPLIFVGLRLGFRVPVIWLAVIVLIGAMIYMLAWDPERRRAIACQQIESDLRDILG